MRRKSFDIYLDKGLQGWLVDTAKRNYWRVQQWHGLDDIIQEGYLAYAICNSRYRHRVKNKSHFMSLFKRVFYSRITDLANKRSRINDAGLGETPVSQIAIPGRENLLLEAYGGTEEGDAEFMCLLGQASSEVQDLLTAYVTGSLNGPRIKTFPALSERKKNGQFVKHIPTLETNNTYFNRVLNTSDIDYEEELREAFSLNNFA